MSKQTISYRGEYVFYNDELQPFWNGQQFKDQQAAHTAINNHLEKEGKDLPSILNTLKYEIRMGDIGDPYGTCMGWKFALADYMTEKFSGAPSDWDFCQAMGGADLDSFEFQTLELFQPTEGECDKLGAILHRWDSMNRARGVDY